MDVKRILKNNLLTGGGILVASLMCANFLNFFFNALLGRILSLEEFSVLTLASTLWLLITIFLNGLASTTTNRTAYLSARRGNDIAQGFRSFMTEKSLYISFMMCLFWIALVPVYSSIFHVDGYVVFASFLPAIILGVYVSITRGYFSGNLSFIKASLIILSEASSKVILAIIFILLGFKSFVFLSIPLSVVAAFVVAFILERSIRSSSNSTYRYIYPKKLLLATLLTIFSGVAFLSIDVLLARHYLTESQSGAYALLSLVGKMVYFLGTLLNIFILTFASRDTGLNKNSTNSFYKILGVNICLMTGAFVCLALMGKWIIPLLFGSKGIEILPYIYEYLIAVILFTIASTIATYHLAKQQFIFAYNGIFCVLLTIVGITFFHVNIVHFTTVMFFSSFVYLTLNMVFHIFYKDISSYIDEEDINKMEGFDRTLLRRLRVSICLPAYNEEKNIRKVLKSLLTQKTKMVDIQKIYVVSSASKDRTNPYVEKFENRYPDKVKLLKEKARKGKASAINLFLKKCTSEVVVIQSADTIAKKNTIELLCRPFLFDENIGMTGGAPIPVNNPGTFLGYVIHTWWWFHRHIPRFGEIIAFRNVLPKVSPRTAVDEAYVQAKFAQMGYKIVHVDESRVFNKGPENIGDIIKQRRRIFNGHTRLLQEENIHISHVTKSGIKLLVFDYKLYGPSQMMWLIGGILIELWASLLGRYDKYIGKVNPVVWDIAKSTKNLTRGGGRT